jgi:iron(II)-dependent oxidoreductase
VRIDTRDHAYEMFTYEASHPRATDTQAFPCAASQGMRYEAPDQETEPCSISGLRPWHSVTWSDANAACSLIGWRLCSSDELLRACGGPDSTAYAFGAVFEGTICNLRGTYRAEGETFASSSPTGHFPECVSAEGLYDLTGNLWEWVSDALEGDDLGHIYQGAGWKTIAERHRDSDQVCSVRTQLHGTNATNFTQPFVGFRCCRDAN